MGNAALNEHPFPARFVIPLLAAFVDAVSVFEGLLAFMAVACPHNEVVFPPVSASIAELNLPFSH
jgi:hypothetical protein